MAHAEPPRRSRLAYPDHEVPGVPLVPVHKCKSSRRQWAAIVVLYLVLALNTYLVVLNYQYVLGRGQFRDAEAVQAQERTTEQIRTALCDMLDGLPQGPVLDPLRVKYGCAPGNGIPPTELPPEVQQQLQAYGSVPAPSARASRPSQSPVPARPPVPAQGTSAPAVPAPVGPAPSAPPAAATPAPTAAPTSAPAPLVDVSPLTDTVCDLLGICI